MLHRLYNSIVNGLYEIGFLPLVRSRDFLEDSSSLEELSSLIEPTSGESVVERRLDDIYSRACE